jgi:DNA-binding NarL/FixJ family response regulator
MDRVKNFQADAVQTLLVVEDHRAMRTMLVDWLGAAFPNYQCLGAASGEEAVELAHAHPPALVLMDFVLPGLNGIETTRRLKQMVPGVGVIMLSMYEAEAYQAEAAAAGASAYLFKRTMNTELIPAVQALLAPFGSTPDSQDREAKGGSR